MALTTLRDAVGEQNFAVALAVGLLLVLASAIRYLFRKPAFPKNAPKLVSDAIPLIGSLAFFTQRWDFCQRAEAHSQTGNFSFYAGQHPVIGVSGKTEEGRKAFFEEKRLGFSEGYGALLAGAPEVKKENGKLAVQDTGFDRYFQRRITAMLKGNQLKQGLPQLLADCRMMYDELAAEPTLTTDPFDSIYRMVFQFTMRTVACNEVADDRKLLDRCLKLYEEVENASTPLSIMYPWIPLLSKAKRTYAGAQLYMIFKAVVDERNKTGRRDDDCLQYLMDHGDSITDIMQFVLGSLFAGQLNSGINAAWILCYLSKNQEWLERVRTETEEVANRWCADKSLPLKERLMQVPIEAWEGEFPMVDLCLKDSIRLQLHGTAFRRNISNEDVVINKATGESIPPGMYAALPVADIHYNPEIYSNAEEWDPGRYLPDRAEDKKTQHGWIGWGMYGDHCNDGMVYLRILGVIPHPCSGMRFAKLENNIIMAFFVAYFENVQLIDKNGNPKPQISKADKNSHTAMKPKEPMYLKYSLRKD